MRKCYSWRRFIFADLSFLCYRLVDNTDMSETYKMGEEILSNL